MENAKEKEVKTLKVFGRDIVTGLPTEKEINSNFVYESTSEHLHSIVDAIRVILERTPIIKSISAYGN